MSMQRARRWLILASLAVWIGGNGVGIPGRAAADSPAEIVSWGVSRGLDRLARLIPVGKSPKEIIYPWCPEGTQRVLDILTNAPPPRMFSPGESRYGWEWLASRFDADGDGKVIRSEFTGSALWFDRLDRNQDGVLSAADFDWSDRSPLVQRTMMASQLLNRMDTDSNGGVSAEEWAAFFGKAAKNKDELSQEDLQELLFSSRPAQPMKYDLNRQIQRLVAVYRGEASSLFGDAPHVGTVGPDFQLKTENQQREIRLSQFRGQRPVVLVFGSFT